ncbi:WYL domain-containing protein, partial [Streptomyces albidoflavus]
ALPATKVYLDAGNAGWGKPEQIFEPLTWAGVGSGAQGLEPSALVGDVRRGVRLRIRYRRAAESAPAWQLVDPYGLLAKAGRWYLVADRSGTPRLYSLERLTDWRPTAAPRRLRPGISLADAVAELTTGWETSAGLRIHGLLAARHAERARRILGSRVTVHRPGEGPAPSPGPDQVALTLSCRNLEEVRQLLPFGADLLITDPPEARTRLRELAAEVVGQYAEQDEADEGADPS